MSIQYIFSQVNARGKWIFAVPNNHDKGRDSEKKNEHPKQFAMHIILRKHASHQDDKIFSKPFVPLHTIDAYGSIRLIVPIRAIKACAKLYQPLQSQRHTQIAHQNVCIVYRDLMTHINFERQIDAHMVAWLRIVWQKANNFNRWMNAACR